MASTRAVRPLPKRQRMLEEETTVALLGQTVIDKSSMSTKRKGTGSEKTEKDEFEVDDHRVRSSSDQGSRGGKLEYRLADHGLDDGTASNHEPRIHPLQGELDDDDDPLLFDTYTTRLLAEASALIDSIDTSISDSIFGQAGLDAIKSLAGDRFQGLFKGLAPLALTEGSGKTFAGENRGVEEVDDEGYAYSRGGTFSSTGERLAPALGEDGMGNKKKRKIPGMKYATQGEAFDDRFDESDEAPEAGESSEEPPISNLVIKGPLLAFSFSFSLAILAVIHMRIEYLLKASAADLPKTAKAALAKLNRPSSRLSLDRFTTCARRLNRKHFRFFVRRHPPLSLPALPLYSAPRSVWNRPSLPLPAGSTLKGSKAVKVAMKAEKEKEKEKARMKLALGDVVLPVTFWKVRSAVVNVKPNRRSGARVKSGLLTPPNSSTSDEADSPLRQSPDLSTWSSSYFPSSETFSFFYPASAVVLTRWTALLGQIQKVLIAKERALRFQKEEMELKLEKAREAVKDAKEEKEAMQNRKSGDKNHSRTATARSPVSHRSGVLKVNDSPLPPSLSPSSSSPAPTPKPRPVESMQVSSNLSPILTTTAPSLLPPLRKPPIKGRRKRAAYANSLNVHHRDNYVPSRAPVVPTHIQSTHALNGTDSTLPPPLTSWPASEEAIAAAASSRRKSTSSRAFFADSDEWLCAWCDYEIMFSADISKAVKKRKKLLRIRKQAEERASRAANGSAAGVVASDHTKEKGKEAATTAS